MKPAIYILLLLLALQPASRALAQPYLDLVNIRSMSSPNSGIFNQNKQATALSYFNVSTTIPFLLKNKKDAVIVSPYFEMWKIKLLSVSEKHRYTGSILPVSFLKQLSPAWSILTTAIVRANDTAGTWGKHFQIGGAVIAAKKLSETLVIKFGTYVNGECFGLFVMPLAGIDWQISKKDCLFGVLPGNMTYQHMISERSGYGLAFRAQTNSYHGILQAYTRIDENQLGGFFDLYLTKNFVLNLEAGHSFFRQVRERNPSGNRGGKYFDDRVNDNVYLKLSTAWRLKLRD